jgi:hypothetical protein
VLGECLDHDAGEPDSPVAGSGLGRPKMQVAAYLRDDLSYVDHAAFQVDAAAAKSSHLADSKAAVGAQHLAEELVGTAHGRSGQSLPGRVRDPSADLVLRDRGKRHRSEAGEDVKPE